MAFQKVQCAVRIIIKLNLSGSCQVEILRCRETDFGTGLLAGVRVIADAGLQLLLSFVRTLLQAVFCGAGGGVAVLALGQDVLEGFAFLVRQIVVLQARLGDGCGEVDIVSLAAGEDKPGERPENRPA